MQLASNALIYAYIFNYLASEWKSFLLLYTPAVLLGILPDKYYLHIFLLIQSIRILLSNTISEERLRLADTFLKQFCELVESYYGTVPVCIYVHMCIM